MNSSEPIGAVFIPRPNPLANGPEWLVNSRLLIVDDKQVRYFGRFNILLD